MQITIRSHPCNLASDLADAIRAIGGPRALQLDDGQAVGLVDVAAEYHQAAIQTGAATVEVDLGDRVDGCPTILVNGQRIQLTNGNSWWL